MRRDRSLPLEIGLLLSFLLAPVFFGSIPAWASLALSALLFLLLFLYPEAVSKTRDLPRIFSVGMTLLLGLLLVEFFFSSANRHATGVELIKWLAFAAAFLLIQLLPSSSITRLMTALVFLGAFESLYGLFQVGTGKEKVLWQAKQEHLGFVTGTYFNRNHLAGLLELCLGVHLGILLGAVKERNLKAVLGWASLWVITLIGFFQTGSRMGIASFTLSFLILSIGILKNSWRMDRLFLLFPVLFLGMAFFFGHHTLSLRWEDLTDNFQNWDGGRILVWKDALEILRDHPWWGTGLGSFEWIFPFYQSEKLLLGWNHAHNGYLELALEMGIPGFLVCMASFIYLGAILFRRFILDTFSYPLLWGGLISIFSFALHGLTDFNFSVPANVLIFILIMGMSFRLTDSYERG